jgi:primosomal protein N''
MGLFGDSQQEKELKALMTKAAETMQNLINEVERHQLVTDLARYYVNQLAAEVNSLYEKSSNLSAFKNMSIKTIIAGQHISLADAKITFIRFMNDFTRKTGEKFPLKYN